MRQPQQGAPLQRLLSSAILTTSLLLLLLLNSPTPASAASSSSSSSTSTPPPPPAAATPAPTSYADAVCKPPTVHPSDPQPPCVEIETIETLCWPNGTAPLYVEAHAECMCRGSYFPEWDACRRCLSLHGQLSQRDLAFYRAVASAASMALCGFLTTTAGTAAVPPPPTAIFRDLFTSAEEQLSEPTTGATTTGSDPYPSDTDVGLYFTATGPLGPGAITGSATAATATGLVVATGRPPNLASASGGGGGASAPGGAPSSPSSSPSATGGGSTASSNGGDGLGAWKPSRMAMLLFGVLTAAILVVVV